MLSQLSRRAYRTLGLVLALLFAATPVIAQDCTPQRVQKFAGWLYDVADVTGPPVPAGTVWEIWRAGLASDDPALVETRLQVEEPVLSQNNACCWKVPFLVPSQATAATPKNGFSGVQYLFEGQKIHGRANAILSNLALLFSGIEYPEACLARRLGLESGATAAQTTPQDFSALVQAAQAAATAMQNLAASVPPP